MQKESDNAWSLDQFQVPEKRGKPGSTISIWHRN